MMKKASKYKTLYQMSRQHRAKEVEIVKNAEDSLDKISQQVEEKKHSKKIKIHKKGNHMRSQSCPFMNPSFKNEKNISNKNISHEENKKTLKKTSMKHYVHKKNKRNQHKYSNSHISQESSTVIVNSIPIEQLSSMLYSKNLERERSLKKSDLSMNFPSSLSQSNILSCLNAQTDIYFETKLEQQIKIYELNHDLQTLQKQASNVKVKQKVLESLARKFPTNEKQAYETVVIH